MLATLPSGWHAPAWSVLRVEGADAVSFVNNLSTNDVKKLAVGDACETLFTDVKGRVVRHAVACRRDAGLDIVVTSANAEALREHLDRYHIRETLTLSLAPELDALVAWGDETMGDAFGLSTLGEKATLRLVDSEADRPSGEEVSADHFHAVRIAHRFPLDGVDIDGKTLPQELGRDDRLISFTKGCYLGQETVARLDALGQVNRLLTVVEAAGGLSAGDALYDGEKQVGAVTTVGALADKGMLALAYVRREKALAGGEVSVGGEAGRAAKIIPPS
ncbi:MAG: hypothetical protein AAGJ46_06705 [Planctomycetota bacterium]